MDLNICEGAYSVKAPIAVQECINLFPEVELEGAQSRLVLRRFPGLKTFIDFSGNSIRGMEKMGAVLFVVTGTSLYSTTSAGGSTLIGTIAGSNLVSMANDGTNLVIVNGTATGYVYNGSSLSTISDADFVSSSKVVYLDTYFVHLRTDTNQIFISESGSATSYISTERASAEGAPDDLVSIIASNRDLILMQSDTTETWRNIGNPDFAFARQEGTYQQRGCTGINSPVAIDNDVYFLGGDGVVYRLIGYQSERISHHAIEKWISEQSKADRDAAIGMSITHQGHYMYVLSFNKGTWVFDATTSKRQEKPMWFQLKSAESENYRVDVVSEAYGKTLCGGGDGIVYELDPDTYTENGSMQLKRRTSPYYANERKPLSPSRIKLGFEQGVGNTTVIDPQVQFSISRDWGRTFGNTRNRSMGQAGQYKKNATWTRNGVTRGDVLRWDVTDAVDVTFTGAYAEFGAGTG